MKSNSSFCDSKITLKYYLKISHLLSEKQTLRKGSVFMKGQSTQSRVVAYRSLFIPPPLFQLMPLGGTVQTVFPQGLLAWKQILGALPTLFWFLHEHVKLNKMCDLIPIIEGPVKFREGKKVRFWWTCLLFSPNFCRGTLLDFSELIKTGLPWTRFCQNRLDNWSWFSSAEITEF